MSDFKCGKGIYAIKDPLINFDPSFLCANRHPGLTIVSTETEKTARDMIVDGNRDIEGEK